MREFVDILQDRIAEDPNLTEAGLATAAGLDNSTIRQMIKFRRSPRIDTAMKICRALGETVESFMSETRDPARSEALRLFDALERSEREMLIAAARGLLSQRLGEQKQSAEGPPKSPPT